MELLPTELIVKIFRHTTQPDYVRFMITSKSNHKLLNDDDLFRFIYETPPPQPSYYSFEEFHTKLVAIKEKYDKSRSVYVSYVSTNKYIQATIMLYLNLNKTPGTYISYKIIPSLRAWLFIEN